MGVRAICPQEARYPAELCRIWISLLAAWLADQGPALPGDFADLLPRTTRGAVEKLYLNDFVEGASWTVTFQEKLRNPEHINISELRALRKAICQQSAKFPDSRHMFLVDSLVVLGACAKGRSSAPSLNGLLQTVLPYILGSNFYPGFDFTPTRINPGDHPSRHRVVPPPRKEQPPWLGDLADGDFLAFDRRAAIPLQSKTTYHWANIVWLLREFDSTLGYPGEGPRDAHACKPDVYMLLDNLRSRNHVPAVRRRREQYLTYFGFWLRVYRSISFQQLLLQGDAKAIDRLLRDFGYHSCEAKRSRLSYSETINAVTDLALELRGHLPLAWDVSWSWKGAAESHSHWPMPEEVFLAFVALALHWDWADVAFCLIAGFLGMLRPGEILALKPTDVDVLGSDWSASQIFIFVGKPKMRRIGPRREHIRIDDAELISFVHWMKMHFDKDQPIFRGSSSDFTMCFSLLCRAMHVPIRDGQGLTPASLRAGGATFWYRKTDCPDWVRFRGRWSNPRMLEVYIQEVAALSLRNVLTPGVWEHIICTARLAAPAIAAFKYHT